jgi:hypothetical protein
MKHLIDKREDLRATPIPGANGPSYHFPILVNNECCRNFVDFKKVTGIFEEDLKNSVKIDEETWRQRPFLEKIKEHFFAPFRKRL